MKTKKYLIFLIILMFVFLSLTSCNKNKDHKHIEEVVQGYDATCTKNGLTEGKKCSICNEILVEQTVILAQGHNYEEGKCTVCGEDSFECVFPTDEPNSSVVVATTTPLSPFLWIPTWGDGGANAKIRELIHGYDTVVYTKNEKYELDPTVVKSLKTTVNEDGGKTYTFEIHDDLKWSDGTPITAKDYVGANLLLSNPVFYEVFSQMTSTSGIVEGSIEYIEDPTGLGEFTGFDLLGDYEFSITINPEDKYGEPNYPYYYEWQYYSTKPYPMHVLLPGVTIEQGEEGAKLSGVTSDELLAIIEKSVEGDGQGYSYNPSVVCGPYKFCSLEINNGTGESVTVEVNPYFKGDYTGQKPLIKTISLKYVTSDTQLEALKNGEVDLIEQISGGAEINAALAEVTAAEGKLNYTTFSRSGYGVLAFHSDHSPTRFTEVRQAIAYLLNRQDFMDTYTGGYGVLPHGQYGLDQWMVAASTDANGNVLGINENGEKVALNTYAYNPTKAVELLEAAGYIYGDEACTKLFAEGDAVRYRKNEDGTTEPLVVEWSKTEPNPVSDTLASTLVVNAAKVGFKINGTTVDFNTLLYRDYYGANGDGYPLPEPGWTYEDIIASYNTTDEKDVRVATMFNFSTNFDAGVFEPYYDTCLEYWGWDGGANIAYFYDEDMSQAARKLTEAANDEEYLAAWQEYQYYYNKYLPTLALYSEEYHEFFSSKIQGYKDNVTANWTWSQQILYCTVTE